MDLLLAPQGQKVLTYLFFMLADCLVINFFIYSFIFKKTYRALTAVGIIQHILLFYTG